MSFKAFDLVRCSFYELWIRKNNSKLIPEKYQIITPRNFMGIIRNANACASSLSPSFSPFCFQGKRLQASTCTIYHNNFCLGNQNQNNNNNNNQNAPPVPLNSCRRQTSGQTDVAFVFFFCSPRPRGDVFPAWLCCWG